MLKAAKKYDIINRKLYGGVHDMGALTVFPFFQGANELHIVFTLDVVLVALLLYKMVKNGEFIFTKDIKFIMILIWSFSYLITTFYSVDTELSFLGFLKFFTVPLFIMVIMQYGYTIEQKDKWFNTVAEIGTIMVCIILVVSIGEKILGVESGMFFYQNRLAGFFNYANSFALFLLIGIIIIGFKKELKVVDLIKINLLFVGILLTNSRAIMIISGFSYLLILMFNRNMRKKNFINLGIMVIVGAIVTIIMSNFGVNNRLAETTGNSSEWVLRILYYKDALRLIVKNIFGYGYMAWWYMQEGFQTGAYDAKFVHNGLLQVALDVGVIPALFIVVIFVMGFFDKKVQARDRVLMMIILGHSLIDFNMEFMAIMLVLFMTLEFTNKVKIKNSFKLRSGIVAVGCIYLFFGFVSLLNAFGRYDIGNTLFPYSIVLNKELEATTDAVKGVDLASKLYDKNKYFLNASFWLSKKEQAFGNYDKAYEYEVWIVKNKKYTMLNYIEYVSFLEKAIKFYYMNGDFREVNLYIERLLEVPDMINKVKDSSDSLAFKIAHKPRLDIPDEMIRFIEEMKKFGESVNRTSFNQP